MNTPYITSQTKGVRTNYDADHNIISVSAVVINDYAFEDGETITTTIASTLPENFTKIQDAVAAAEPVIEPDE